MHGNKNEDFFKHNSIFAPPLAVQYRLNNIIVS